MKSSLTKVLGFLLAAAACSSASASLSNPLEYNDGQRTGLQLSETTNLSIEDIVTGEGGWIKKYRFAKQSEIDYLLNQFLIVPMENTVLDIEDHNMPRVWDFISQVGGQTPGGPSGTYFVGGWLQGAAGRGLNMYANIGLATNDGMVTVDQCPGYSTCAFASISYEPQSWTSRSEEIGFFMVRSADVPEPSSIALFGIGVAAVMAKRRKAK